MKYGDNLKFVPLLVCASTDLVFYEQRAIDVLKPRYNISPTAGSPLGVIHSRETRAKISATLTGRQLTLEHRAAISKSHVGLKMPLEFGRKVSAAKKGKPGRSPSPEHLAAWVGAAAEANRGRTFSPERLAQMSAVRKGRPKSPEHRAKISAGLRAYAALKNAATKKE